MRKNLLLLFLFLAFSVSAQESLYTQPSEYLFNSGVDMMDRANYGSARQYFERYLASNDSTRRMDAEYYRALCALKLYNLDGEQLINRYIADYPSSVKAQLAYYELGVYFFQDRDYKKTITYLTQVNPEILDSEKRVETQYKLAYSYFARRQFDQALTPFNKLKSSKNKYTPISHYYAAYIEFEQQNYDAALADYMAISDDKNFATTVPYMISSVYYYQEDYKSLLEYAEPIVSSNSKISNRYKLMLLLAESQYSMEKYDQAVRYYNEVYGREKFTTQVMYHYGYSLRSLGMHDQAIEILKSIADQKSEAGILASYTLGELYILDNNKEYALPAFKQVAKSDNGELSKEAMFVAGKLAFELGRTTESINTLSEFVEAYPADEHVQEANQIISQALLATSNYKLAMEKIESMSSRNATINEAYQIASYHYGVELYNKRQFKSSVEMFNKSLENTVNGAYEAKTRFWIGEALSVGRRFSEARPYYEFVLNSSAADNQTTLEAAYGLAYCYYNSSEYAKALPLFRRYVQSANARTSKKGDALVRLADCYYVTKDYNAAIRNYNAAISGVVKEKDYAYYQSGVVYGIQGEYSNAFANLNRVVNSYQSSPYYDDALFDKGQLQMERSDYQSAITTFTKLISEKPKSPYVPFAYERRAVANFNTQNYANMASDYKSIVLNHSRYENINNALLGLQEALTLTSRSDEFDPIFEEFKRANPEAQGLEKVEFETLKSLYNSELYQRAIDGLLAFLEQYPDDVRTFEARYLLARSYYRLGQDDRALQQFLLVLNENQITQMPRAVERVAEIYFKKKDFANSNKFYNQLKSEAASSNQKHRAWQGLMEGHFELMQYDSVDHYSQLLQDTDGTRSEFVVLATLYQARANYAQGKYELAEQQFLKTTQIAQDGNAAEAQYFIGQIKYNQGLYVESNEELYKIPERFGGYTEWLDKAFLLVADNFVAMEEYFQAKATLQSIIENSGSELTVTRAQSRLETVNQLEEDSRNFVPDSLVNNESDTLKNEN